MEESIVSRDERNEYYNVTMERAQAVLDVLLTALNAEFVGKIEERPREQAPERELVPA